ncbi:N-acylneuraminate-9-phosphatase [Chanos chanos]|uniref:N-acylneuraminate-9-phosphatase n=1 Tax=Chanos chanos TaxID=29144 RepID=A0A6J2V5M3_CHACN|nr:N-acylneuraminate-9-phosphatase [Chanos chanos]
MEKKRISAILFDLDNTLIDTAGAGRIAIQKVSESLRTTLGPQCNVSDICDRFTRKLLHESFDPSADRTIDDVRTGHWQEAIQEVQGSDPGHALASDCYYTWKHTRLQHLALTPQVQTLLEELKKNYKLLLLTNGEAKTQREKIEAVECSAFFDIMVVGGEHAEEKPAVAIFSHCFELLGVKPQDCVMVGDSLSTDIVGGFNARVRATVWINSKGVPLPEDSVKPDYTVPSVLDLPGILAQLD